MARRVEFTITDGEVDMDLKNFNGVGCKDLADSFKSLGAQTKEVIKPEIHETCNTITSISNKA
jgi:hypothetical protein